MADCQRLSATWEAIHFAPTHPGADAFLDEVGFEFRDGANDGQKQPAHRAVRGDVFPARDELNPKAVKLIDDAQEVLGRTRYPVKGGNDAHAELPLSGISQHGVQARATSLAAGDTDVGVLTSNLKAPLFGENAEVVKLIVDALVGGAYPGVDRTFLNHRCLLMLSSRVLDGAMIARTWLIFSMAAFSSTMTVSHNAQ
jgi:hypothetical protein